MIRHYAGRSITFATMHGKEALARDAFRDLLGAHVSAPVGLDTDRFGTFSGDIPRTLLPLAAAREKARAGMQVADSHLGLASEGSFGSRFASLVENTELLVFIDYQLGLEIVEVAVSSFPLPGSRRVNTVTDALDFARALRSVSQEVTAQAGAQGEIVVAKDFAGPEEFEDTVRKLLLEHSSVVVMPDYRAHKSPLRAQVIRTLCHQMATRLATPCPVCKAPGFGKVDVEHGLPCSACGSPTMVIAAEVLGCGLCHHRALVSHDHSRADPRWCNACNP